MKEKDLLLVLILGTLISCILMIMSVDKYFNSGQYFELGITSVIFTLNVIILRHFKIQYERLQKMEKLEIGQ